MCTDGRTFLPTDDGGWFRTHRPALGDASPDGTAPLPCHPSLQLPPGKLAFLLPLGGRARVQTRWKKKPEPNSPHLDPQNPSHTWNTDTPVRQDSD